MSDSQLKILLFLFWPILAPIMLIVITVMFIIAWFVIPFARVDRTDGKLNFKLGN